MSNSSSPILSTQLQKWVIDSVDPLAAIQTYQPLQGGISAILHSITLTHQHEPRLTEVVLRQFHDEEWLRQEPDLPRHEANCLLLSEAAAVPTPKLIAFDETGALCGRPAVIMSKLDGKVILQPDNMEHWLNGMAQALSSIHHIHADHFSWTYFRYNDIHQFEVPEWSAHQEKWKQVIAWLRSYQPSFKPCFIHRDYHPTNILWNNNQVSGVVDWVNSCLGPLGVDLGHCRVNLAMLYGTTIADAFLAAYQQYAAPGFQYDPYWDFVSLVDIMFGPPTVYAGWTDLGFTGLTDHLMIERLDAYFLSLWRLAFS